MRAVSWKRRVTAWLAWSMAAAALLALALFVLSELRVRQVYPVSVQARTARAELAAEGRHLAASRGCMDCHGQDLAGHAMIDDPLFARVSGSNLTMPPAGHPHANTFERLARALRHGVDMDSRALVVMPSTSFANLSAHEIEALAAYLDTLAPVERAPPPNRLGPIARTLLALGQLDALYAAEAIDHDAPMASDAPPADSLAYGKHLVAMCTGCHAADLGGGPMHHGKTPASNLTPHATGLAAWTDGDFLHAMRTGQRPDGSAIDGSVMPYRAIGRATDAELQAIWRYLRTVPPVDRARGQAP